jgi:hypothetical protein
METKHESCYVLFDLMGMGFKELLNVANMRKCDNG